VVSVRHVAVAALALGCTGTRGQPDPDTPESSGAIMATWQSTTWQANGGVVPGDLGRGVVFLAIAEDKGALNLEDALLLRVAPDSASVPVGAMLFSVAADGQTTYRVAAADSLRPNLVEHGYEESGVPFDSTDDSGRWVRAILGYRADGSPLTGWIDIEVPGTGTTHWAAGFIDRPIFFRPPALAAFYSAPDSATPVAPPPADVEYAMYPEQARGPWLRVRVVQPSDVCIPPDSVRRETRTLWIRFLDDRGRPNVWYYTRGC
jgi:hypothetical protein